MKQYCSLSFTVQVDGQTLLKRLLSQGYHKLPNNKQMVSTQWEIGLVNLRIPISMPNPSNQTKDMSAVNTGPETQLQIYIISQAPSK